jgi:transposase
LAHPEPAGYRLKEPCPTPKIGPHLERIAQIIEKDKALLKKQRHTAHRINERLREMGYGGKYTQVKETGRELLRLKQEVFMPLVHRTEQSSSLEWDLFLSISEKDPSQLS